MFGYVKPVQEELLVKELEFYRATYCGICRAMKRYTGKLSNVTLSYDSVFLALVRMLYVPDDKIGAKMKRCIAHPLKKRCILNENEAVAYTAKAFAALAYHKLDDDAYDEKRGKRLLANITKPLVKHAVKREDTRELAKLMADKLCEIRRLEKEGCGSVDIPASLFGEILGEVFSAGLDGNDRLVTRECGYHLGRFIYSADAAEDYEKDLRCGSYNPYVIAYEGKELSYENRQSIKCALVLECKGIEGAINLLPFGSRRIIEGIIKNIIYYGLIKRIEFLDAPDTAKEKENVQ